MRQSATERAAAPSLPRAPGVGAGVGASVVVGAGDVVGAGVGAGVGAQVPWMTPHDVASHKVPSNAYNNGRMCNLSKIRHQPRSWSKAEAWANIESMSGALWTAQPPMSRLKAEA